MVDPVKEKLNQGSGKVVVTNDVKGNQLYAKEEKMHLDQRKKMDIREDKNLKIDVNAYVNINQGSGNVVTNDVKGNQLYAKERNMYLDQRKKMDVRDKEFNDYHNHRVNIFLKYCQALVQALVPTAPQVE